MGDAACAGDFVNVRMARRDKAHGSACFIRPPVICGFKCYDEEMKLKVDCARSNSEINNLAMSDDSVEFYVRAASRNKPSEQYVRFACNSECVKPERGPRWNVAAARKTDHWTVEMEIPCKSLGAVPRQGDIWGVNFCRNNPGLPPNSWSYTQRIYAQPNFFGWARLE